MRMVLQSYLAEIDESSEFSQHAPGRQLALEIGRSMAANDSRSCVCPSRLPLMISTSS